MPAETPNARRKLIEKLKLLLKNPWLVLSEFDSEQVEVLLNYRIRFGLSRIFLNYPTLVLADSPSELIFGRKRHAVRSGVNKAKSNGYTSRAVSVQETEALYLEVHRRRNEHDGLRPLPHFQKLFEGFTPVIIAVVNRDAEVIGFAYGLGRPPVLRLQVSVTTTRNDGARFLLTHAFLCEAGRLGFKVVLPDPPNFTSESDSYYQRLWGFSRTNLFTVKIRLTLRKVLPTWKD